MKTEKKEEKKAGKKEATERWKQRTARSRRWALWHGCGDLRGEEDYERPPIYLDRM
jgi:hypothetical protein